MSDSSKIADLKIFHEIYHEIPAICLLLDQHLNIVSINRFGRKQLGYEDFELTGQDISILSNENEKQIITQNLTFILDSQKPDTRRWECTKTRKDGSHLWVRDTARLLPSKSTGDKNILLLSEDITETRYLINELTKQASTDALTGLFNRNRFERHLEQAILSAQTNNQQHTLCYIDLDQFKVVNDVCGHMAGDELLRQITAIIKEKIRHHDIFARLGGDEFGLLLQDCTLDESSEISHKILDTILQYQFSWGEELFNIGASMGMAAITKHSENAAACLKMADTACFSAKQKGRKNIQVYNSGDSEMLSRDNMQKFASRLNYAFENNRFVLYHQKICPLIQKDNFTHLEILVRMLDEKEELIYPDSFIPAAEYYGLATKLDLWVTRHTLLYFQQHAPSQKTLCNINLSGKTIGSKDFVEQATRLIQGIQDPQLTICFEVTETAAISNVTQAVEFIKHFKKLGCLFALDDFGSGFSSFAYLKNLPVDFLKLDGYFVRNIIQDSKDLALVRAIHQVADVFGIQTIAEFVENREIMTVLTGLGIDFAQGYHIHKPEPLAKL